MGVIATIVAVGIFKGLAKVIAKAGHANEVEEALATEFAGAAGKYTIQKAVELLADRCVGTVEDHHEFRGLSPNDREAVHIEVEASLAPAIDRSFLESMAYNRKKTVTKLFRMRGHDGRPSNFSQAAIGLYQQSLDAAVRATIAVAQDSKEWHTDNARAIHDRLDDLAENLTSSANMQSQILSVLEFLEQSVAELGSEKYLERRDFLERYYRAIRNTLDRMELYGLDVKKDNPARSQQLSVAYISLNLTAKDAGANEGSRSWEAVLDTLSVGESGRLLVRGDAGMGKTTLLRWAAIAIASQTSLSYDSVLGIARLRREAGLGGDVAGAGRGAASAQAASAWRSRVPLLIVLRECPDGAFPKPEQFPLFVNKQVGAVPAGFVEWLLERGKALVMIDGLDEVPAGKPMDRVSRGIVEQLDIDGDRPNLFIATSRPLVRDPEWVTQLKFREAVIAPMTDPERDALIRKWHDAVAEQTLDPDRRAEIEAMPADLIRQLNDRPAIARLATVPLLCAMICAQSGPLGSKLPGSEFAIINKLAETMLWVRDRDREVPKTGTPWDDLPEDKRVPVAARLAHFLISTSKSAVPWNDALQRIRDGLRFAGWSEEDAEADAPAILGRMGDRSGVVRAPEDGLVEFVHKTFCEFLSAFHFADEGIPTFLADHAVEPGPSNVCRFVAGGMNRKFIEELIGRVLDRTSDAAARGVVALRMKIAARQLDPGVHERVKAVEARMIPPRSREEANAIADLGDEIVGRLVFASGMAVEQQIMNAMALSQVRSAKALTALGAYAATAENMTLIEVLCRAINPLTIPFVRGEVIKQHERRWLSPSIIRQITDGAIDEWLHIESQLEALALDLDGTQVTDAGVRGLARAGFKALATLNLGGTKVTDAGVRELARAETGLKALARLDLTNTKVTDAGVRELARAETGLKALTTLSLGGTRVTDAGVRELARAGTGLKALATLYLGSTPVTDAGVRELARAGTGLKALATLDLWDTHVTDAGVRELARAETGLKALAMLGLGGTRVTDAGVRELSRAETGLKALDTLDLNNTPVTDAGVRELSHAETGLKALATMHLGDTPVTDAGVRELARAETGLKALATLYLGGTKVTDAGVKELARAETGLKALATLYLGGTQVTDAGVKELARAETGLKALATLYLGGTQVTDAGVRELARAETGLKALATLYLGGTQVTDAGVRELARAETGLKALVMLDLNNTPVTDVGVAAVKSRWPGIKVQR